MRTILDVSNIVYGGYYGSPNYRISGFPLGGVRKTLGIINAGISNADYILCFDSGSEMRKELAPQYKAGRPPSYAVAAQLDLLKEILLDCNMPFYIKEGAEADDLICSVVSCLAKVGDTEDVTIYSDDRDLSCCVSQTVSIKNATSNGICIDKQNYERRVVKGERIPYNTILLYKMLFGDRSDNYPGVKVTGLKFADFSLKYLNEIGPYIESGQFPEAAFFDRDIMEVILNGMSDTLGSEAVSELIIQSKIVFPQLFDATTHGEEALLQAVATDSRPLYQIENEHMNIICFNNFNRKKFDLYCSLLGLNRLRPERYGDKYAEEVEAFKERLHILAKELSSGVMAVERYNHNSHREPNQSAGDAVVNMELPI